MGGEFITPNPDDDLEALIREQFPYEPEDIDPRKERVQIEDVLGRMASIPQPVELGYFKRKLEETPPNQRVLLTAAEQIADAFTVTDNEKNKKMLRGLSAQNRWLQLLAYLVPIEEGVVPVPYPYGAADEMVPDIESDRFLSQEWKDALIEVLHDLAPRDFRQPPEDEA